jgi:hypothetical protein
MVPHSTELTNDGILFQNRVQPGAVALEFDVTIESKGL